MPHAHSYPVQLSTSEVGGKVDVDEEELYQLLEAGLVRIMPNPKSGDQSSRKSAILRFLADQPWAMAVADQRYDQNQNQTSNVVQQDTTTELPVRVREP